MQLDHTLTSNDQKRKLSPAFTQTNHTLLKLQLFTLIKRLIIFFLLLIRSSNNNKDDDQSTGTPTLH